MICATLWWAFSARLAKAFIRQRCAVSAVCPPGHPLRYITGITSIYTYQGLSSIRLLGDAIRMSQPALIVPCDDTITWQLYALYESEPDLRPLIEQSLGSPEAYPTIQRRSKVLWEARELGIRVPFTRTLNSPLELQDWQFDAPAVLKLDGTWGGEGVAIVRSLAEAARKYRSAYKTLHVGVAWKRFLIDRHAFALWSWHRRKTAEITIQEFIQGQPATTMFACWHGEVLASTTVEVLASQGPTGAATVIRVLENDEIENAVHLLARRFQLSGFHGLDFILETGTDAAWMLELNPRATQLGHLNLTPRGNLASVMAARLRNGAGPDTAPEDPIQDRIIALFPHAFKSALKSPYLSQAYPDVPWEEPALVRELARVPWPERQWLSRIYHCFRLQKRTKSEHEVLRAIHRREASLL